MRREYFCAVQAAADEDWKIAYGFRDAEKMKEKMGLKNKDMGSNNHSPGWIPASRGNFLLLTTSQISKSNKLQPSAPKIFPAELRGGSGVCSQGDR